jgi:hypothetical protein
MSWMSARHPEEMRFRKVRKDLSVYLDCRREPWTFLECNYGRQETVGDFPTKAARVTPKLQLLELSPEIISTSRFPDATETERKNLMQRFLRTSVPQEAADYRDLWRYDASFGLHR